MAIAGVASHAVAEFVRISKFHRFGEVPHTHTRERRPEDFLFVDAHVRRHVVEKRTACEEPVFMPLYLETTTVNDKLRAFLYTEINIPALTSCA